MSIHEAEEFLEQAKLPFRFEGVSAIEKEFPTGEPSEPTKEYLVVGLKLANKNGYPFQNAARLYIEASYNPRTIAVAIKTLLYWFEDRLDEEGYLKPEVIDRIYNKLKEE